MADIKLTPKQELFCREYMIDLNAMQAAVRAGYSPSSARNQGSLLLDKPEVQNFIAILSAERNSKLTIDAAYVLRQAVLLHERCMQQVKPKTMRNKTVEDEDGNTVYEFDATNALKALELIGKHVSVGAFKERMEMTGDLLNAHFMLAPIKQTETPKFASSENEIEQ